MPTLSLGWLTRRTRYSLVQKLDRHDGTIDVLALSSNGQFIATGGDHGLQLFSTNNLRPVPTPAFDGLYASPVVAAAWAPSKSAKILVYGRSDGSIAVWKEQNHPRANRFKQTMTQMVQPNSQITSIAWQRCTLSTLHCAVASAKGKVSLYKLNEGTGTLDALWGVQLDNRVAIMKLVFTQFEKELCILGEQGEVLLLDDHGAPKGPEYYVDSRVIGGADFVVRKKQKDQFVVDTREGSYELYELRPDTGISRLQTYTTTDGSVSVVPKGVRFAEQGKVIVAGGDDGNVYVFGKETGEVLQFLRFGRDDTVRHITVAQEGTRHTIVAATRDAVRRWTYDDAKPPTGLLSAGSALFIVVAVVLGLALVQHQSPGLLGSAVATIPRLRLDYPPHTRVASTTTLNVPNSASRPTAFSPAIESAFHSR